MILWRKLLIIVVLLLSACMGEEVFKTFISVPNGDDGEDAIIAKAYPTNNYDRLKVLHLSSRIKEDSIEDDNRFVLSFEIEGINTGAQIDSAFIHLYGTEIPNRGENSFYVQRITYPWIARRVTWKGQPKVVTDDQIVVIGKVKDCKIDVTPFIQGFAKKKYRNLGFMFRLVNENQEDKIISFHSSNSDDTSKRPRLEINYRIRE